ncbi:MAG: DUF111 family protein [Spirochaetales bacterium]|nr:DUF111 family protein [Spirochaetales bacterium]
MICIDLTSPFSIGSLYALLREICKTTDPDALENPQPYHDGAHSLDGRALPLKEAMKQFPDASRVLGDFYRMSGIKAVPFRVLSCLISCRVLLDYIRKKEGVTALPPRISPASPEQTLDILKNEHLVLDDSAGIIDPLLAAYLKLLFSPFTESIQLKMDDWIAGEDPEDPGIRTRAFITIDKKGWIEERIGCLATNLDDITPQVLSYCMTRIMELGALDYTVVPAGMKKGRMSFKVEILCRKPDMDKFIEFLFRNTSSLGIRKSIIDRAVLDREIEEISTEFGEIKVKRSFYKDKCLKIMPEFEDIIKICRKTGISIQELYYKIVAESIKKLD